MPKVPSKRVPVKITDLRTAKRMKDDEVDPNRVALAAGHGSMPFDLLATIGVERVMAEFNGREDVPPAVGLFGHIVTLDFFAAKHKVMVKSFRDPSGIEVLVDGKRVFCSLADDEYPGPREAMDRQRQADADMVEHLDLQPGDEVEQDGDVINIKRATPVKKVAKKASKATKVTKKVPPKPVIDEDDIEWE